MIVIATVPVAVEPLTSTNPDPYASEGWQIMLVRVGLGYITVFGLRELLSSMLSNRSNLKTELRVMAIGVGWAMGHSLSHYLFPLLPARGTEFKWDYIIAALSSNAYFFTSLGQIWLLWLSTKQDRLPSLIGRANFLYFMIHPILETVLISMLGWTRIMATLLQVAIGA